LTNTILMLLVLQLVSCASSQQASYPATAPDPLPGDLRIVIGEGGGIAGLMTGYTVVAAGDIFEWRGRTADQDLKRVGALDPDTVKALWGTINSGKFLDRESTTGSANFIQMMSITANKSMRTFEWPVAVKEDSTIAPIVKFRARCLEAVRVSVKG